MVLTGEEDSAHIYLKDHWQEIRSEDHATFAMREDIWLEIVLTHFQKRKTI